METVVLVGPTAMYLVSLESSSRMQENGVYFMLISWILFELSKLQIWKFIYFCQFCLYFDIIFIDLYRFILLKYPVLLTNGQLIIVVGKNNVKKNGIGQ